MLVVSELVTNAVVHTRCRRVLVAIALTPMDEVIVAVANRTLTRDRWSELRAPRAELAESGRGLDIVRCTSNRVGMTRRCGCTVVWARLSAGDSK